jgi:hypothetical protein
MNDEQLAYNLSQATYGSDTHHKNLVNQGYTLDPVSNDRNKIYVGKGKTLVGYRGTDPKSIGDLRSDVSIVTNKYQDQSAFKDAENYYDYAQKTHGNPIVLAGHSLGGTKAIHVAKKFGNTNSYAFNPGTGLTTLDPGQTNIYKSKFDPVSGRIGDKGKTKTIGVGHSLSNFESLNTTPAVSPPSVIKPAAAVPSQPQAMVTGQPINFSGNIFDQARSILGR